MRRVIHTLLTFLVAVTALTFAVSPSGSTALVLPPRAPSTLVACVTTPTVIAPNMPRTTVPTHRSATTLPSKPKRTVTPAPSSVPAHHSAPAPRGARTVKATGYCSCAVCCGKSNGITASGAKASWGTIAAPRSYATGTRFTISGFGNKVFTVQDRGGAISGNRIDIWFPTHQQALDWGVRTVTLAPVQ